MLTDRDLIEPLGELTPSLFPSDDATALAERLNGYLAIGYDKSLLVPTLSDDERDQAARSYAYYRAYKAILTRLATSPQSMTIDGNSRTIASTSPSEIRKLMNDALAEFSLLVPAETLEVEDDRSTHSVRTKISW